MTTAASELSDVLAARRYDSTAVLDNWVRYQDSYQQWDDRVKVMDQILRDEWDVVWPDLKKERALPKIPNYPKLAMEHRARLLAETIPTISCRAPQGSDKAKLAGEKRERIIAGWWQSSRVPLQIQKWGFDLMVSGVAAVKVLPDYAKPIGERFPCYQRLDPRTLYPGPKFAEGPFIDDAIIAYEALVPDVKFRFKDYVNEIDSKLAEEQKYSARTDRVKVIEFYSGTQVIVVIECLYRSKGPRKAQHVVVVDEDHGIGKCPIAVGTRPSWDDSYRGDFDQTLAMLNTLNRLTTMSLDAAARKVYATLIVDGEVENPNDEGPGAIIQVNNNTGSVMDHVGWLQHPASAYDGANDRRSLDAALRTSVLLPPSTTGDPNESVVSAAGIAATQSMPNAEVVSLQRDSIGPMLQAANELAMRGDEKWGDTTKTITGVVRGAPFSETYTPSKDIDGNYTNDVIYGMGSGLDKVNLNVMLLQNKGEGMISDQTAREKSPFVDDPVLEKNRIVTEQMEKAAFSGIVASAAAPPGDPRALPLDQLAAIWEELEKPDGSLKEAIKLFMPQQAPLAPPPQMGAPALASPGIAGAGEPQQPPPFQGPPLAELTGA
jgi:hypothetical protein